MKRAKLRVLFFTAVAALLLVTCSDGIEQGGFATVTIRLGKSGTSKQLVWRGDDGISGEIPLHTYELTVVGKDMEPIPLIRTDNTLTGAGVPAGEDIVLIIWAYIDRDVLLSMAEELDIPIPDGIFTSDKILRAIGVSDPVTINAGVNNTIDTMYLYSAMEVSNWEELAFAVGGPPEEDRIEIIILKNSMDMTGTIDINRPIFIWNETNVTLTRASDNGFTGPFFIVNETGELTIGVILEGESTGPSIKLDGGYKKSADLKASDPLIIAYADCTIGKAVTLQNNYNSYTGGEGTPGGGVYIYDGTFTLYGNIMNNTSEWYGTGVYMENENGSFVMENGAVIGGNANVDGGAGVYMAAGTFTMNGGTIGGKTPNDTSANGGGVLMSGGKFLMDAGALIGANKANSGGGVYISGGSFKMKNEATISGNEAKSNSGGGVYIVEDGNFVMEKAFVKDNTASFRGGGVYIGGGSFVMENGAAIEGNKVNSSANESGEGGGVFVEGGSFVMRGGVIGSNSAKSDGGGVYINEPFNMSGGTIINNEAGTGKNNSSGYGGGGFVNNTFNMSGGTIKNNKSPTNGGGVYLNNGTMVMENGTLITGNTAVNGGGVCLESGTFTMKRGAIIGGDSPNNASSSGGGVYMGGGSFVMESKAVIKGNKAPSGGGVYTLLGIFTMNGGTISNNEATGKGGGVYITGNNADSYSTFEMNANDSSIEENKAHDGGGVCYNGGNFNMKNGAITDNKALGGDGGGVYMNGGMSLMMTGGGITFNEADGSGGGVWMNGGNFNISQAGQSYLIWVKENRASAATSGAWNVFKTGGSITGDQTATNGW